MIRAGKTQTILGAIVLAVALIAGGLSSGFGSARAATASVTISSFAFTPPTTNINVGDTVTWTNSTASTAHTVTSDTAIWDSGQIAGGGTFSRTFTSAGTFPYHCTNHPTLMMGTVVVSAAATTTTTTATTTTTTTATATTATATPSPTTAPPTATPTTPPPTATSAPTQPSNAPINLTLTGAEENPPVTTSATGKFLGTATNSSLSFTLTASGTGITQAHIHQGAKGTNGPIVAFLLPLNSAGVSSVNVSGTITEASLIGPLAGNMAQFQKDLAAGNLYVNVHTLANPGGEIRAQIPGTTPGAPATGSGAPKAGNDLTLYLLIASALGGLALAATGAAIASHKRG